MIKASIVIVLACVVGCVARPGPGAIQGSAAIVPAKPTTGDHAATVHAKLAAVKASVLIATPLPREGDEECDPVFDAFEQ